MKKSFSPCSYTLDFYPSFDFWFLVFKIWGEGGGATTTPPLWRVSGHENRSVEQSLMYQGFEGSQFLTTLLTKISWSHFFGCFGQCFGQKNIDKNLQTDKLKFKDLSKKNVEQGGNPLDFYGNYRN